VAQATITETQFVPHYQKTLLSLKLTHFAFILIPLANRNTPNTY